MSHVAIDKPTGVLVIDGKPVFPLGFSNPPPLGSAAPSGKDALHELAAAGASFIRTGRQKWTLAQINAQIAEERAVLDAAAAAGLHCWLWLGDTPNLPVQAAGQPTTTNEQLLTSIVTGLKDHPGLGAYKGIDEPHNSAIKPDGLIRAYRKLKTLDSDHPLVIIQAPRGTVADLKPFAPTFDITGADIFPVAYPAGKHSDFNNDDISVVGDVTKKMVASAAGKPVWMTLQIAWIGSATSAKHPDVVPRFPTLHEERFMAYQAIVNGARGLSFFGGHLTQIARQADARAGWNWTFWQLALRPLLEELTSTAVQPALLAEAAHANVTAAVPDIELAVRQSAQFLYVIAVRRGTATSRVTFSGLPRKNDGTPMPGGQVLFEYVQEPLPPPIGSGRQVFRSVAVSNGSFSDWFGPHDVHLYRFAL